MSPVFVDGLLYVLIAMGAAAVIVLSDNEIYKYASPYFVFYAKSAANIILAGATALKTYRSSSYADHVKEKKESGNTTIITK